VRVVNDDGDVVDGRGRNLEAAWDTGKFFKALFDRFDRHTERGRRSSGCEDVVHVRFADQFRFHVRHALRHPHVEGEALEPEGERTGSHIRVPADRVGHRPAGDFRQRHTSRVVNIHNAGCIRRQHLEQPALGGEVRLHVLVKIEMIPRQVREDSGSKVDSIDATHRQRVG
jgi:hypothetical protein